MDISCSQSLASMSAYQSWQEEEVDVLTINSNTLKCSRVVNLNLHINSTAPLDFEVLVVDEELLGFDLLLWFDTIKKLD